MILCLHVKHKILVVKNRLFHMAQPCKPTGAIIDGWYLIEIIVDVSGKFCSSTKYISDSGWKWLNKICEDGAKNAIGLIYHYARQSLKEDDDV